MRVASFIVSSPGCLTAFAFGYRFPSFRAIPKIAMAGISGKHAEIPVSIDGEEMP
jgi:hypothetical protein